MSYLKLLPLSIALVFLGCSKSHLPPIAEPGNVLDMAITGFKDSKVPILLAKGDYYVAYFPLDGFEENERYQITYSGIHHISCSKPGPSVPERENLVALRRGEIEATTIGGKTYKNLGIKEVDFYGRIRTVEVFQSGEVNSYFDSSSGEYIGEHHALGYLTYITNVATNQPLDPDQVSYAKQNCVPEPLE